MKKSTGTSAPLLRSCLLAALPPAVLCAGAAALARPAAAPPAGQDAAASTAAAAPLLDRYCVPCHGAQGPRAGVDVTGLSAAAVAKAPDRWANVARQVRNRHMPPAGSPQPTPAERDRLSGALDALLRAAAASAPPDPGRVLIRRLNRAEYNNSVRDLFGVAVRPADSFPADGSGGGGFDNNADTLYVPPILMERYLAAAGQVLDAAPAARLFVHRPGPGVSPRAAAKAVLEHHAYRAWRRPVAPDEAARLLGLYDAAAARKGASWESAVRFALKAVLVSPNFLFRAESDRVDRPAGAAYPVSDYALASRLSYFLWSSKPDDALLALAAKNRLRDPAARAAQVRRMLRDPRAAALADGFAGQWLRVRELYASAQPDPKRYPEFTPALREAMYREPVALFDAVARGDRSVLELLDARYTFVNEDLAKLYGIPNVTGPAMRKVPLADGRRGGVLTTAAVLTLTSYPQRTSPVLRGKWVLEQVLGTPAPPPPQNVATLPPDDAPKEGLTFRQRLEKHREKPECAGCHSRMDPLGFGLENFDAIGRWRTGIAGAPVDASGVMADGTKFSGPGELKAYLLAHGREDFVRHLTEQMLSYALGRGLGPADAPAVRRITEALEKDGYRSGTLIQGVVDSYPFLYRRNEGAVAPAGQAPERRVSAAGGNMAERAGR